MKYKEGQTVHVKLAGLIVAGIIKSVTASGDYIVQFEGGTEKSIPEKSIKLVEGQILKFDNSPPKSESRSSSRQSPSRRSPGRIRSKTSPSRRSPSRRTKASLSPSRIRSTPRNATSTRILKASIDNIDASGDYSAPSNTVLRKRKMIDSTSDITYEPEKLTIYDKRIEIDPMTILNKDSDKIIHLKHTENDLGKFSDDDEIITEFQPIKERKSESKSFQPPNEFGGRLGVFILTFLIPGSILSLHILCDKDNCSFSKLPILSDFKFLETYIDIQAIFMYLAYVSIIILLSKVPYVGKEVKSQPSKERIYVYQMNGLFTAFFILIMIAILEYEDIPLIDFLHYKYFQLLVCALIFGCITSIILFVRSRYVSISLLNPYASTYNFFYDFFMGRQVNPRIFNIDVKIILMRVSFIAVLIFNSVYLYKSLNILLLNDDVFKIENITFDPTLYTCAILQIFYVLDFLYFEKNLTTTFEFQYEGLGYMKTMVYATYPFFLTATTKYLYEHNSSNDFNYLLLGIVCLFYLIGYIIYRKSNSQKNAFRLNPYNPALKHLRSMPTGHGKNLLISGWWGKISHPNYLGDIIMHLAIGALCGGSPAGLGPLSPALLLATRAVRDSQRCRRRYGVAWDKYKQKVRYNILPLVY